MIMIQIDKPFARESGPWSLPSAITESICRYAGRQSSAALYIAIGPHEKGGVVARKAIYYEPFTYWDWQGVHADEPFTGARGLKRQLLWERQRGYRSKGHNGESGYPSPRDRWQAFKTRVAEHKQRCLWVKRIAVAHWMDEKDMDWISRHLTELESLDLSDAAFSNTLDHTSTASNGPKAANNLGERIPALLSKLRWLGIPDLRAPGTLFREILPIRRYLSMCNVLRTLCIRDTRDSEMLPYMFGSPEDALDWITETIASIPSTATTLELRLCQPSIEYVVAELLKRKSAITHIGVDLGAWARTHSPTSSQANHSGMLKSVAALAYQTTLENYEKEHNKVFPAQSKWWLPSFSSQDNEGLGQDDHVDRPAFAESLYQHQYIAASNNNGTSPYRNWMAISLGGEGDTMTAKDDLDSLASTSVYENLFKLYRGGVIRGHGIIQFYPLIPEWQVGSTAPIQPLAMIRPRSDDKDMSTNQLTSLYGWMTKTFGWRPVFDWDCFMKLDFPHGQDAVIGQIAQQLQIMRDANTPIRILIGRRHSDLSSLYWGCDEVAWADVMSKPFNNSLDQIAPLVDALIIHYDLRNPLSRDRLQDIDEEELYTGPTARCPRSLCPWSHRKCPFGKQWHERFITTTASGGALAVFRSRSQPKPCSRLASSNIACLPTGEDANVHPSDDYNPGDAHGESTLHKLARHAAYLREAVCWQRFWTSYAAKLTNLSELHVRMPRNFDRICNSRLRKLLDPRDGWKMHTFAEERQHMQTREDLEWKVGNGVSELTHLPEAKIWPGGRFVRRLWIRTEAPPTFKEPVLGRPHEDESSPGESAAYSGLDDVPEEEIEQIEREELERATKIAKVASQKEETYRKKLQTEKPPGDPEVDPDLDFYDDDRDNEQKARAGKRRIRGLTANEQRHRLTTRHTWLVALQDRARSLSDENIETVIQHDLHRSSNDIKTIADDAVKIRKVLQNTRTALERLPSLFLDDALQCAHQSPSFDTLAKRLEEKRAAPMAAQIFEEEAREAAAKAKAKAKAETDAAAVAKSSSANTSMSDVHVATPEVPETPKGMFQPQSPPDDSVPIDTPGLLEHGLRPSQSFAQPQETMGDDGMDSLFGESPERGSSIDPPARFQATPPPETTIQTKGGDSPTDTKGADVGKNSDSGEDVAVLKFPSTIPETIDVDRYGLAIHTASSPTRGLGTSILGTARVPGAIPVTADAKSPAKETVTMKSTEIIRPASPEELTIEQTTLIKGKSRTIGSQGPDDIVTTTETSDITTIQETQTVLGIPETPGMTDTPIENLSPLSSPPKTKAASKQVPRRLLPKRTPDPYSLGPSHEPEKPAVKKRTRSSRSATPAVGSRHSTRSVTPVSYKEVNSDGEEEDDDDDEKPKKKRKTGLRGNKVAKKMAVKNGGGGKGRGRAGDEGEGGGEDVEMVMSKKRGRKKKKGE
ncbi:hypothetical protein NX059_000162 [Plenodomus lindquistii]|nr:hypothetical protein NX059_000162 [Plenodomus lindquistii]